MNRNFPVLQLSDESENLVWLSEAYKDFKDRITNKYLITTRIRDFEIFAKEINMIKANSSQMKRDCLECLSYICPPFTLYWCTRRVFEVKPLHFAFVKCKEGKIAKTEIYGPGTHILGYYKEVLSLHSFELFQNYVQSSVGDLKIVKVLQGNIVHFELGGQNIILGPGIHLIREPLRFVQIISLDSFYVQIGPEKWITIPQGFDGVSMVKGKLRILEGGKQYHLTHIQERFIRMLPKTIQTDKIPSNVNKYIQDRLRQQNSISNFNDQSQYLYTSTAEGTIVMLEVMIFWKITDSYTAATQAIEIFVDNEEHQDQKNEYFAVLAAQDNIKKLRTTVINIVKSHVSQLVGMCTLQGLDPLEYQFQQESKKLLSKFTSQIHTKTNQLQPIQIKIQSINKDNIVHQIIDEQTEYKDGINQSNNGDDDQNQIEQNEIYQDYFESSSTSNKEQVNKDQIFVNAKRIQIDKKYKIKNIILREISNYHINFQCFVLIHVKQIYFYIN